MLLKPIQVYNNHLSVPKVTDALKTSLTIHTNTQHVCIYVHKRKKKKYTVRVLTYLNVFNIRMNVFRPTTS